MVLPSPFPPRMSFKASLVWEHSDIPCLMIDTSRSRQVTLDPGEMKSISHQTQLQPLHHLRLMATDGDPGCAHNGNKGVRLRSRGRLYPSSTSGKIPSVRWVSSFLCCNGVGRSITGGQTRFLQMQSNVGKHKKRALQGGWRPTHMAVSGHHGKPEAPWRNTYPFPPSPHMI